MSFETDLRNSCNLTDHQMRRIFASPQMKAIKEVCRRHPDILTGTAHTWATGVEPTVEPTWHQWSLSDL